MKGFAQPRFYVSPDVFDGVEIWGVSREKEQGVPGIFDEFSGERAFVKPGIVENDDGFIFQGRQQMVGKPEVEKIRIAVPRISVRRSKFTIDQPRNEACSAGS